MSRSLTAHAMAKLFVVVFALAAICASGVGVASVDTAKKTKAGGSITIANSNEVPSLDPVKIPVGGSGNQGTDRALLVFGSLLRLDANTGTLIPGLAESMATSDGQVWTLKLRADLKFSDGTPFDAQAVIFNMERFRDPVNGFASRSTVQGIVKMTAVDARTVEFKLDRPDGTFNYAFADSLGMIGSPTAIKASATTFGQKPIGAGAFLLKEWVRDSSATFVRSPTYFDQPRPYLDQIVVRIVKDTTQQVNLMKAGEIDVIHVAGVQQMQLAKTDPKTFFTAEVDKINGGSGVMCNIERSPCNDVRFREALWYAFDVSNNRQIFTPDVQYKSKQLACAPFGLGSPYCAKDVVSKYDPKRAQKLFDAVKADGINTDIVYTTNDGTPISAQNGEWVQQQLAKYGIKVTVRLQPVNVYTIGLNTHDFQVARITNPTSAALTTRYYNDWHSVGGALGGRDIANLNSADLDVALEKGKTSISVKDQIAGWQQAQRVMAKDFLVAWTEQNILVSVGRTTVKLGPNDSKNATVWRYEEVSLTKGK